MSHLNERIAEFVFEELSPSEMTEARRHIAECSDCREQVKQFQLTYATLKTSPVVNLPRPLVFEFEKPRVVSWMWRWLAPMSASAAVAFAVASLTSHPQIQIAAPAVQPPAVVQPAALPAVQPVDYQKIINDLRAELKERDTAHTREIQRVAGKVDLLDSYQLVNERETLDNSRSIQLLASRTDTRE